MATHKKTVQYAWPMVTTSIGANIAIPWGDLLAYTADEIVGITAAFVEVGWQDTQTAATNMTRMEVSLNLNGAGISLKNIIATITNSGEQMAGVLGPYDFTTYFQTNWNDGGALNTITATGKFLGPNTRNLTLILTLTYEYNDLSATQTKTVRVPFDCSPASLPTSTTEVGTDQIPALDTFLPEAGVVIRDMFVVYEGNEDHGNSTTDYTISVGITGHASLSFGAQECALASDRFCRWIWKLSSFFDTSTVHQLTQSASAAAKNSNLTATLYITYDWTLASTTRHLNSLLIPIELSSPIGSPDSTNASRFTREISIQDPGTITLRHSAVRLNWNCAATPGNVNVRVGGQGYRAHASAPAVVCGMFSLQQRFDSLAEQGAGMTLARGLNDFVVDVYTTNATNQISNAAGYIILNYESDLSISGTLDSGRLTRTIMEPVSEWDGIAGDRFRVTHATELTTSAATWWLVSAGFYMHLWVQGAANAVTFDVEVLPAEAKGAGYIDIYADAYQADNERSYSCVWMRGRDVFNRFPGDADNNRLDLEEPRDYRVFSALTVQMGIVTVTTFHSWDEWFVSGTISGNNPALETQLELVRAATGEVLQRQTPGAGTTSFSFRVQDNTELYYVSAYQDATHVGRSASAQAT